MMNGHSDMLPRAESMDCGFTELIDKRHKKWARLKYIEWLSALGFMTIGRLST